jgi:hypothetical protein
MRGLCFRIRNFKFVKKSRYLPFNYFIRKVMNLNYEINVMCLSRGNHSTFAEAREESMRRKLLNWYNLPFITTLGTVDQ